MQVTLQHQEAIRRNAWPAIAAIGVLMLGAVGAIAIKADRATPLTMIEGEIVPDTIRSGERITVRWLNHWNRICEGELSRQLIGSDKIVRAYQKRFVRIPINVGMQYSDTEFKLPPGLPPGETTYEGVVRFRECGFTSRFVPLEVKVPPVYFNVTP